MATKKQTEEVLEETSKIYPVEVELTEDFLEKNPTIKGIYKEGKLNIEMSPGIEPEFAKEITDVIGDLRARELGLFNPLLAEINHIAEFKSVIGTAKPKREEDMDDAAYAKVVKEWIKSEEEVLKKMTGKIRSFNGDTTRSKTELKKPYAETAKKIDTLYNAVKSFSTSVAEKIQTNFKELYDEKQRIADEKEAILKKAETEKIADLEKKNEEANQKILESEKKSTYADLMTSITQYFTGLDSQLDVLNISGLQTLRSTVEEKEFEMEGIGPMEIATLKSMIKTMRDGVLLKIDTKISNENNASEKTEVEEFAENLEKFPQGDPTIAVTDSELFVKMAYHLANAKREIQRINCRFTDPRLEKLASTMETQISGLTENLGKLEAFVDKKAKTYNNL